MLQDGPGDRSHNYKRDKEGPHLLRIKREAMKMLCRFLAAFASLAILSSCTTSA